MHMGCASEGDSDRVNKRMKQSLALNRSKQITIENVSMMQDIPDENRLDKPPDQRDIAANEN